jgi:hypothetical protein
MEDDDFELENPPASRSPSWLQEHARMMTPMNMVSDMGNDWRKDALCKDSDDPNKWFAPDNTVEAEQAATECFECPARKDCLLWASLSKQRSGIWGGQPPSVRLSGTPHEYEKLVDKPNPYDTPRKFSRFYRPNLITWDKKEEDW